MKNKILLGNLFLLLSVSTTTFALTDKKDQAAANANAYNQTLHVINSLANTNIKDMGMTPTTVLVKYYNGGVDYCWKTTLKFSEDTLVNAAPGLGCENNITRVEVIPIAVADKLTTYRGPVSADIPATTKFPHLTIVQEDSYGPTFDMQTGLVTNPGRIKLQVTSE